VSIVARRHDLNANMLFTWRRGMKRAPPLMIEAPVAFVAAEITGEPSSAAVAGRMEVVRRGTAYHASAETPTLTTRGLRGFIFAVAEGRAARSQHPYSELEFRLDQPILLADAEAVADIDPAVAEVSGDSLEFNL
jgi:hypothetical protein